MKKLLFVLLVVVSMVGCEYIEKEVPEYSIGYAVENSTDLIIPIKVRYTSPEGKEYTDEIILQEQEVWKSPFLYSTTEFNCCIFQVTEKYEEQLPNYALTMYLLKDDSIIAQAYCDFNKITSTDALPYYECN